MESVCRVCLCGSAVHRVADTALEQTYERVTGEALVAEGRPCCVCGVCLAALRRCRRFVDTAREANIALERWRWSGGVQANLKETHCSLFTLTQSVIEVIDLMSPVPVPTHQPLKQESDHSDNDDLPSDDGDNFFTEEIKYQVTDLNDDENTQGSDDENDNTVISEDANSDITHCSDDDDDDHNPLVLPKFEYVSRHDNEIDEFVSPETLDNVDDGTAPDTSNVGKEDHITSDEDIPLQSFRSRKRVKLTDDTSVPVLKSRRLITASHQPRNTDPSPTLHKDGNMFTCQECQYMTSYKGTFKRHLMTHTDKRPFICNKFDFKCSQKANLQTHLMTHTGEKPFSCDKCDYKCSRKAHIKTHLMTHTGEKPFSCDKCDYKCSQKSRLKIHSMTHTGEKPFICNKCDFKCSHKGNLKTHLMTHTGEKPFSCDKCDYKCSQKAHLKTHLMTHIGKKSFECDKCQYKCSRKNGLIMHLITHSGTKLFACDKCDYKCSQKDSLRTHLTGHV